MVLSCPGYGDRFDNPGSRGLPPGPRPAPPTPSFCRTTPRSPSGCWPAAQGPVGQTSSARAPRRPWGKALLATALPFLGLHWLTPWPRALLRASGGAKIPTRMWGLSLPDPGN